MQMATFNVPKLIERERISQKENVDKIQVYHMFDKVQNHIRNNHKLINAQNGFTIKEMNL